MPLVNARPIPTHRAAWRLGATIAAILAGLLSQASAAESPHAAKAREAAAERVYAEAVRLFQRQQLYDLRAVLERLAKNFPDSPLLADATRKPSCAEMLKAVEGLGKFLAVRRDGAAGAFRKVQEAIDAATPNSTIELQDEGPYNEKLVIPKDKERLTLRGKKPFFPVIASAGAGDVVLAVEGAETALERLVLSHQAGSGAGAALAVRRGRCRMHSVVLDARGPAPTAALLTSPGAACEMQCCVLAGNAALEGDCVLKDSFWPKCDEGGLIAKGAFKAENSLLSHVLTNGPAELRNCTVAQGAAFKGTPSLAIDCILYRVEAVQAAAARIEFCDVHPGGFLGAAEPGKGCLSLDPRFMSPKELDYRLGPASPCRQKGSEGGDLGCRPSTEMTELAKKALDLRRRGTIAF